MKVRLPAMAACCLFAACSRQAAGPVVSSPPQPQGQDAAVTEGAKLVDRVIGTLGGRRSWPSDGVKVWLSNPTVVVTGNAPDGETTVVHAWPANENDFDVPMMRINSGDTLYQMSDEEYRNLEKLNGTAARK